MENYDARLDYILQDTPIIDTHNDFPYLLRLRLHNEIYGGQFDFAGHLESATDVPRLRQGRVGGQFWSVFIECQGPNNTYQDFNYKISAVRDTLEQIDVTKRALATVPDTFQTCYSSSELKEAYQNGKIASMIGVEGLHQVDVSLGVIRQYFELGVRYITLTHNCDNPFATAASSVTAGMPDNGLTAYGKQAVAEMNRLGMLIDLSHVSHQTMRDVIPVSKAPVIFSHSAAYSLTPVMRNVPDDVLKQLITRDGVVQVNFYPGFIQKDENTPATIDDAVDHIMRIAEVAGWEHVGLGSDFDGGLGEPAGLEDVSKYPDLIKKCMERGATDDQIRGLMGANLLRVWAKAESVACGLKSTLPVEANWPDRNWTFYPGDLPQLLPNSSTASLL